MSGRRSHKRFHERIFRGRYREDRRDFDDYPDRFRHSQPKIRRIAYNKSKRAGIRRSGSQESPRNGSRSSSNLHLDLLYNSQPISPSLEDQELEENETLHERKPESLDLRSEAIDEKQNPVLAVDNLEFLANMRNEFGNGAMCFFVQAADKLRSLFQDDIKTLSNEVHDLRMENRQLEQKLGVSKQNKEDQELLKENSILREKLKFEGDEKEKIMKRLTEVQEEVKNLKAELEKSKPESYWRLEITRMEKAYIKEQKEMEAKYKAEIEKLKNQLVPEIENKQVP